MNLTELSIRRPVTITMLMIALVLIGVLALTQLPEELFPNLSLPVAAVHTSWPGASPTQMEQQVTAPIEQILQELPGVAQITSTSSAGQSSVIVLFSFGVNLSDEVNQMRSLVNQVERTLPNGVQAPVVEQFNPSELPILTVELYGHVPLGTLSAIANNLVAPPLEEANGVGQVNVTGALQQQVTVTVNPHRLALYHLSITQVTQALQQANVAGNAGPINRGTQQIPLYVTGQVTAPQELEAIPIPGTSGLTLGDVATAQMGYATPTILDQYNGQPAVQLTVVEASGANTVDVASAVEQAMERVSHGLPAGVHWAIINNQATTILDTIHTVAQHTLLGFIIGVLVILGILRSLRTTMVIAVAIPIAFLSTFILLWAAGLSLNSLTLGSLAVGLGSLVDFSVVVLESIFRARMRGLDPMTAARDGTREVQLAVYTAALAQICVFLPAVFTPGLAGQFFMPIGLSVSFSHIAALFVAVTFTPMLASRLLRGREFEGEEPVPGITAPFRRWAPFDWFGRGMYELNRGYRRVLAWALGHRGWVVLLAAVMFFGSVVLVPRIGFELVPAVGNGEITVSATLPPGTSLATANQFTNRVVVLMHQHLPGLVAVAAQTGGSGPANQGASNVVTVTAQLKNTHAAALFALAFQFGRYLSNIPGAQISVVPGNAVNGPAAGQVSIAISGPDLNTLTLLSEEVAAVMEHTPGLQYVSNSLVSGTPQYQLTLDPQELAAYGLNASQVLNTLATAMQGEQAATFYQGDQTYPIVVQLPQNFSEDIQNLSQMTVTNAQGQQIPVLQLGQLSLSQEPPVITHINGLRTVTVTAEVFGTSPGQAQEAVLAAIHHLRIPAGYFVSTGAARGLGLVQTLLELAFALVLSVVLVYMVMASLFESLLTPFVIMFSLPPTFVGAAWGLFLTHRTLNIDSLIGVIMLIGLVTNNAIVLVDYTNQLRARGLSLPEALLTAGPIRLRPILMTTMTTVLAMLPLAIGGGTGESTLASMATVITFGLSLSMLVSLVLVPVMYVSLDRETRGWRRALFRARPQGAPKAPPA
ncbi:MAG: efflux RND transporter permease subunit [Firmicutes bacterium]|nr:efflux RND transporter permease subunit [Alicyclobacillaceae bacterium]MCL6497046.1 efflux RND transporter permease subunit [Bacillota bacterium]